MVAISEVISEGAYFPTGDVAAAMGAIAAGCTFCSYYPITPASEIFEYMAKAMPKVGGIPIQMEDELASINAAAGAALAGRKAMTATSGPGLSLKMHGRGWAIKNEIPMVIVDVQRAGPANGVASQVGQGDIYQARYGTHGGNYEVIALSPCNVQETFDLIIEAFNLAEIYRTPVMFLMDEVVGHTREKLIIPPIDEIKARIVERKKPNVPLEDYAMFAELNNPTAINVPFPAVGDGYGVCVSPYTHNEKGYGTGAFKYQDLMARRLVYKIRANIEKITKFEMRYMDDAESAIVSFGCAARPSLAAVDQLREEGSSVGFMRLISLWPFPDKQIHEIANNVDNIFVVEENIDGQVVREVERASRGAVDVFHLGKAGVEMHTPEEIVEEVKRHMASKRSGRRT